MLLDFAPLTGLRGQVRIQDAGSAAVLGGRAGDELLDSHTARRFAETGGASLIWEGHKAGQHTPAPRHRVPRRHPGRVREEADRDFIVDLPDDVTRSAPGRPVEGTATTLPQPPLGTVQIYAVSPNGGGVRQITSNAFPVASTIGWSPDGTWLTYAGDDSLFVTNTNTGETIRLTPKDPSRPILALCADFSPDGRRIAYQRVVRTEGADWNQVFVAELSD